MNGRRAQKWKGRKRAGTLSGIAHKALQALKQYVFKHSLTAITNELELWDLHCVYSP